MVSLNRCTAGLGSWSFGEDGFLDSGPRSVHPGSGLDVYHLGFGPRVHSGSGPDVYHLGYGPRCFHPGSGPRRYHSYCASDYLYTGVGFRVDLVGLVREFPPRFPDCWPEGCGSGAALMRSCSGWTTSSWASGSPVGVCRTS